MRNHTPPYRHPFQASMHQVLLPQDHCHGVEYALHGQIQKHAVAFVDEIEKICCSVPVA